jgi:hypothetical protein
MEINSVKALQDWGKVIEESTGIKDPVKVAWMSKVCAIQDNDDKMKPILESAFWGPTLNPSMTMQGAGAIQFPNGGENGFSGVRNGSADAIASSVAIAMQAAAQTIALDLLAVVPVSAPQGQYRFYDTVYEGGRINGDLRTYDKDGNVSYKFTNAVADPLLVEVVEASEEGAELLKKVIEAEGSEAPVIEQGDFKLTFVELGFISGKPIFLVERKDAKPGEFNARRFNGAQTLAEAFEGIFVFGQVNTKENHITAFTGRDFYENSVEKTGSKNPYDNNFGVEPFEREEGEATTVNFLGAKRTSFDYKVRTYQVGFSATWEQIEDAQADGQDIIAQIEGDALNELSQSTNKYILTKMWELAGKHADRLEDRGEVLNTYFKSVADADEDIPAAYKDYKQVVVDNGGETSLTLQARVMRKLLYAANIISHDSRLSGGKFFAIGSTQFVTAVQSVAGLTQITLPNNVQSVADAPNPIGQVSNITLYQDPNLPVNYTGVLVGRITKPNDPGLIFLPYIMAKKVTTTATATFAYAGAMKSRFALLAAGHYPDLQYLRFDMAFSPSIELV